MSELKSRGRGLQRMLKAISSLVTDDMLKSFGADREDWEQNITDAKPEDGFIEFCPFSLYAIPGGWELADGDPICNGCFNTFTETFPMNVKAQKLVDRMIRSTHEGLVTE